MKIRKHLSFIVLLTSATVYASANSIEIRFLDDEAFRKPLKSSITAAAGSPSASGVSVFVEQTKVASLCASSSPNVVASRRNAMGGMAGIVVNTDPEDPVGWYLIPSAPLGWQWHDIVTSSTFPLLRGDLNTSMSGERGNRLLAHFMGRSPIGVYEGKVSTTLTNISETVFAIGKNSSGVDRRFNVNLVGVNLGGNGILDSTYSISTGIWTQSGDDTVFSNGELPADVIYDIWYDFGATIVVTASSASSLDGVKNQFIQGIPTLTVELIRDETVVHSQTITAERPRLSIHRGDSTEGVLQNVRVYLDYGQYNVDYRVEWSEGIDDLWSELESADLQKLGDGIETDLSSFSGFFRVKSRLGEVISPASSQTRTFRRVDQR